MKEEGRFRLMPSPQHADLIVEIQYVRHYPVRRRPTPDEERKCDRQERCKGNTMRTLCHCASDITTYVPQLDLTVRDAETHAVLRTFARLIETENAMDKRHKNDRQEVLDRNLDDALNSIVSSFGDVVRGDKAPESVYFPEVRIAP